MFASPCPFCRASGIPYSHKVAATLDTLTPARCEICGEFSIVAPFLTSWLVVPEAVVVPVGFVAWLATENLRLAVQVGLLVYAAVICIVAKRAQLVSFVPDDECKLKGKRKTLLWALAGGFLLLLSLTVLVPVTL